MAVNTQLVVTFNHAIQLGEGEIIEIRDIPYNNSILDIDLPNSEVAVSGNTLTISLPFDLPSGKEYKLSMESGAVKNLSGKAFEGIQDATSWTFKTENSAPEFSGNQQEITVGPNTIFNSAINTSDPDYNQLVLSSVNLPSWLNIGVEGTVETIAGGSSGNGSSSDGTGTTAILSDSYGIAMAPDGTMYFSDDGGNLIRSVTTDGVVTTIAGSIEGDSDGAALTAKFNKPKGLVFDANGILYIVDSNNYTIRKLDTDGTVTTIAGVSGSQGSNDGTLATATFNNPRDIAIDSHGNLLVTDHSCIRKIDLSNNTVSTFAGSQTGPYGNRNGAASQALFGALFGIVIDANDNVFVNDRSNHLIKKVNTQGLVTTYAGSGTRGIKNGVASEAQFSKPEAIEIDTEGNIYVYDAYWYQLRKISPTGIVTTLAGSKQGNNDGVANEVQFNQVLGIVKHPNGLLYITEAYKGAIRSVVPSGLLQGTSPAVSGKHIIDLQVTDPFGALATQSYTINVDADGPQIQNLSPANSATEISLGTKLTFVFDEAVTRGTGTITIYDKSNATEVEVMQVTNELAVSINDKTVEVSLANALQSGTTYYVNIASSAFTDQYGNSFNGLTDTTSWTFSTVNTLPVFTSTPIEEGIVDQEYAYAFTATDADGDALAYTVTTKPSWLALEQEVNVSTLAGSSARGSADGAGAAAQFNYPTSVALDNAGNLYVSDTYNHKIRKITSTGVVSTLAGSSGGYTDGTGTAAKFKLPRGVAVDKDENVYVSDSGNHKIRKITPNGVVSTLAGSSGGYADGTGTAAKFKNPYGIAVDKDENVYVADYMNHKIRKITSTGVVSTLAGSISGDKDGIGMEAQFQNPYGIAVDKDENVYVADYINHKIRKITSTGVVSTLAGSGAMGFADGTGTSAKFKFPLGVAVDGDGNVYVGDKNNNKIRKITSTGVVSTLAGSTAGFADGTGTAAQFYYPSGVAVDKDGNVYVSDYVNHKIRKITNQIKMVLTGTPGVEDIGDHQVVLEANDGNGGTVQQTFIISVKGKPSVTAAATTDITSSGVKLHGNVTSDGNATITERGFIYSKITDNANPTRSEVNDTDVFIQYSAGTTGSFSESIRDLDVNETYSYRAFATNSVGTTESSVQTFTTQNTAPTFTSSPTLTFQEGDTYTYTATVNDIDSDLVSMSVSTLPSWVSAEIIPFGKVTTFAGGTLANANFNTPFDVAIDSNGYLYVADTSKPLYQKN